MIHQKNPIEEEVLISVKIQVMPSPDNLHYQVRGTMVCNIIVKKCLIELP